jgi:pimeloyl-ACP methyl ester carboxylesterase
VGNEGYWHRINPRIGHLLIRYMRDRERHEQRWVTAMHSTDVPLSFVWGMLDLISGAHMAQRIRERLPEAPLLALEDVAHWPQLETPEQVVQALLVEATTGIEPV